VTGEVSVSSETVNTPDSIAAAGEIHDSTPGAVLRWCEASRFTGTLRFTTSDETAEIPMLGGAPEVHDAEDPVARAVERFTSLRPGTYALSQCLPPIEGATAASSRSTTVTRHSRSGSARTQRHSQSWSSSSADGALNE